ncbi:rubrerythrin family protein [Sulfolobus sp. A20]|uniref:VIT1/CCC1 transporter family protein n=1 Tax=Sulfolobaceae TaxID=118883 RepID=UPI000845E7E6|nr:MULTISPECIES: VIT1/CCC1 transporter family protein [unclassified Sulfolobus]TRM75497.1 rubrerythrin family protein [Sulfolobus sp. E5]TRM75512.1 rubrerythrin family protein [Sulfolobus sp. B5]TRM78707.1 rubrerythrin family protein [Sulfolobus sp. A20-N-F8]TRM87892.1 rubrerythrin family protein [Sulfolobus sp. C3]TRM95552.1 rubrerythrin family protein [Sulfolobus sp. A20-N-G8]TRM98576.1 rubrerythrin family protein [Sulfolobus sp. E1]
MQRLDSLILKNYKEEMFDYEVYRKLARIEKDDKLRRTLTKLSEMERSHSEFWKEIADKRGLRTKGLSFVDKLKIGFYSIIRRLLGTNLTIMLLEAGEEDDVEKYKKLAEMKEFEEEKSRLESIMLDEAVHEKVLGNVEAKNVGDFVYGISDGLVEVLAAVSGLSGAISSPIFVAVGGLIIGASGTLSMSIGAYLSTKSEKDVKEQERKKLELEKIVDQRQIELKLINFFTELGINRNIAKKVSPSLVDVAEDILYPKVKDNPIKSALITGASYITGAIIPVIPYIVGLSGLAGVISSYVIAGLATFVVGSVIGLLSGVKPFKKGLQMTILALLAALATHGLGYLASKFLPHYYIILRISKALNFS